MNIKNLNFFKFLVSVTIFIIGVNFFYQGSQNIYKKKNNLIHNKIANKIANKIKDTEIINQDRELEIGSKVIINEKNTSQKNLIQKIITVKKNDTFTKIINSFFDNKLKNIIINKLNQEYNLKNLKIGQKIFLYKNNNFVEKIILPISFDEDIVLEINNNNNNVILKKEKADIKIESQSLKFNISSSLYEDGVKAGIPLSILSKAIQLYSFDIDFQRDIRKNTKFEVNYNVYYNEKKQTTNYGNIEYIKLKIKDQNLEYFILKTQDGFIDYYNKDGKNVKKSILKTPIDGAKISSNFGMRTHPISGYNKLHKGVDFAAPKGTPVFAGGNGKVEFIGNNGGYGKYIRLRHNNGYKTAYAHLSRFNKNISKGDTVNQGNIIGYVGSTGNSTGPHLHYEIIFQNKQINPMTLKLPSGKILTNEELTRFKEDAKIIYAKHLFYLYE